MPWQHTKLINRCVRASVRARACVCVCVCVCARTHACCFQCSKYKPKACAVKYWTTFERVYFNNDMEQTKKNWYVQTVLPWEKGELFTRESKRHCRQHVWPSSGGSKMRFVKAQHLCFWPSSGLFSSADQFLMLPSCQHTLLVSGCPKNTQLDAAGGHLAGLRSLNHPACYAPEGASSTCCLFSRTGEATWAFFFLENVMPSFLKTSVLVTVETPHAVEISTKLLAADPLPVTWQGTCELALGAWGR